MKILVLETKKRVYSQFLHPIIRDSCSLVGHTNCQLLPVATLRDALNILLVGEVAAAVLAYNADKGFKLKLPDGELVIRDSATLVRVLRAVEKRDGRQRIPVLGISSHPFGKLMLENEGADTAVEKAFLSDVTPTFLGMIKANGDE